MTGIPSYMIVKMVSGDLLRTIERVRYSGIPIYDLKFVDELTAQFTVNSFDYNKLRKVVDHGTLKICKKGGYFLLMHHALKRRILLLGSLVLLILTLFIPTRVLFLNVEGNTQVDSGKIKEAAMEAGVLPGISRRVVRSEKIKNSLLERMPQLQWAGITTNGCVANISVREKNVQENVDNREVPDKITAERDGVIVFCTAIRGNLLCNIGQAVAAGETLISGFIDCGSWIRKTGAEGEIFALTSRKLDLRFPSQWICKQPYRAIRRNVSVILGKKRINLWKDSGIYNTTYDRIYEEYCAFLPGEFQLPVTLVVESFYLRETESKEKDPADVSAWIEEFAESYLVSQMISGEIQSKLTKVRAQEGTICLTGEYSCTEMIGRAQREEIGAMYE